VGPDLLVARPDARHREFDTTVRRGAITEQGPRLVRWAAIEAVQHTPKNSPLHGTYEWIVERHGAKAKNSVKVAAARKLLTLVHHCPRDGEIRCLTPPAV